MKRSVTTEKLFNGINIILKEKGKLPDTLGYGLTSKFQGKTGINRI